VHYARELLVSKMRKIARLELQYRTQSLRAQLMAADFAPEVLMAHRSAGQKAEEAAKKAAEAAEMQVKREFFKDKPWIYLPPEKPTRASMPLLPHEERRNAVQLTQEEQAKIIAQQIALKAMDAVTAEAELVNKKLQIIKTADEATEGMLLYRLEEDAAEAKCLRRLASSEGVGSLFTERMVLDATDTIMAAYGFLISPGARYPWTSSVLGGGASGAKAKAKAEAGDSDSPRRHEVGWDLTLAVLVYAFDTDCSGTFDEGEVRLLLRCAFCGLPDRKILYRFPEVRTGSTTLEEVVKYLSPRVGWRRGVLHRLGFKGRVFVSKTASIVASAMLLVSLSRQLAREKAEQATALARSGDLMEEEDEKNDDALMMRSQMFAMRQVRLFYSTTSQGKIQFKLNRKRVKHWWYQDVWKSGFSREGLLSYAFLLHAERGAYGEILITELPHLVSTLVARLHFKTTAKIAELAERMGTVKTKADVVWLKRDDVFAMLKPMLQRGGPMDSPSPASRAARLAPRIMASRSLKSDVLLHMTARARQQAVLVALGFEGIFVAETNYRCSVLGLRDVLAAKSSPSPSTSTSTSTSTGVTMNWDHVPKEATPYLLLSSGYTIDDLYIGDIPAFAELDHRQGGLALERVDVKQCLRVAREQTEVVHSTLQGAFRWARWLAGFPRYLEYRRIAKVVALQRKQLDEAGAVYLREILKGQSHCVKVDDEED